MKINRLINVREQDYCAPEMNVLDITVEGVLCTSGFDSSNGTEIIDREDVMDEL